jgi:hypothetical protein
MTIIARLKQRREKRKIKLHIKMKSPMKQKTSRAIRSSQQYPNDYLEIPAKRLLNDEGAPNPIEVDDMTMTAMELEVQDLVAQSKKPVTVASIANALVVSNRVMSHHANQGNGFFDRFLKQMKSLTIRRKPGQQEKESLGRRYALMNALNYLEKIPDSHKQTVTCWEEAKPKLREIFTFPEETETADKESKPDDGTVGLDMYKATLESSLATKSAAFGMQPSHEKWKQVAAVTPPKKLYRGRLEGEAGEGADLLSIQIRDAESDLESRKKSAAVKDVEERLHIQEKEEEARKLASSLMRPLTDEEHATVKNAMYGMGPGNAVIAQSGTDSVQRASMQTLQPGQWVGDEVITYFLLMLSKRDEEMSQKDPARKRCHFFKSFFFTKLLNEGHANPDMDGTYEYRNVKRWSKKVPGKDIFKLDKVIFPLNVQRMHWICAVAFIAEKRIQVYDSMGSGGSFYLDTIFRYLQDEHKDKKGGPLPDIDQWQLVTTTSDTPRQRNGKYHDNVLPYADTITHDMSPLTYHLSY